MAFRDLFSVPEGTFCVERNLRVATGLIRQSFHRSRLFLQEHSILGPRPLASGPWGLISAERTRSASPDSSTASVQASVPAGTLFVPASETLACRLDLGTSITERIFAIQHYPQRRRQDPSRMFLQEHSEGQFIELCESVPVGTLDLVSANNLQRELRLPLPAP